MSVTLMGIVKHSRVGQPGAKIVLAWLADSADDAGWCNYLPRAGEPNLPIRALCDYTEMAEKTVRRHLTWLEKEGFIIVARKPGMPSGYRLVVDQITAGRRGGNPGHNDRTSGDNPGHNDRTPTPVKLSPDPGQIVREPRSFCPRTPVILSTTPYIDESNLLTSLPKSARAHARGDRQTGKAACAADYQKTPCKTDEAVRIFETLFGRSALTSDAIPTGEAAQWAGLVYRVAGQIRNHEIPEGIVMGFAGDVREDARAGKIRDRGAVFSGLIKAWWKTHNNAEASAAAQRERRARDE